MIIRDQEGRPFSKWKPAAKYEWVAREMYRDLFERAETEWPVAEDRRWRFDYAWPELRIAVEIDGFGYGHQAQQRIAGQNEKRNWATSQGWRVLVFDSRQLGSRAGVEDAVQLTAELITGAVDTEWPSF